MRDSRPARRQQVQDEFLRDDIRIIVATVAFGMGIDKSNIRFVVHYDLPKNIESYYQETGRAGRDGLAAEALLLFGYGDIAVARGLIEQSDNPEQKRIELHKLNAMVGFAEALSCRRRILLGYFGEVREEDCGNCDICLNPPEMLDVTEDARKALSCVYRVGQRFGMGHVIDVLRGSQSERLLQLRHDQLSTYGIGADQSQEYWGSLLRHLVHQGFLQQDVGNYSVLKLNETAWPLLRGEQQLTMARPRVRSAPEAKGAAAQGRQPGVQPGPVRGVAGLAQTAGRRGRGAAFCHLQRCHPGGNGRDAAHGLHGPDARARRRHAQAGALRPGLPGGHPRIRQGGMNPWAAEACACSRWATLPIPFCL